MKKHPSALQMVQAAARLSALTGKVQHSFKPLPVFPNSHMCCGQVMLWTPYAVLLEDLSRLK
jgi:hypothetical protein